MPLMLHCGAMAVTRAQLAKVHTPKPTRTWVPLPHVALLEMVEQGLASDGLEIADQAHGLGHQDKRYFGLLEIRRGDNKNRSSWVVGLRNSHDQRFGAGLVAGARVLVCDNLSFSGDVKLEHKHTRNLQSHLSERMPAVLRLLNKYWHRHEERISIYQSYGMNDAAAHDLVIRAVDAGCLPQPTYSIRFGQLENSIPCRVPGPHGLEFVQRIHRGDQRATFSNSPAERNGYTNYSIRGLASRSISGVERAVECRPLPPWHHSIK